VAEAADWKEKYQQALRQFAADEKRWQSLEALLRRIVSRVSAASLGLDENLDQELTRLSASIRRQGGVEELGALFESLSRAIEIFEKRPASAAAISTAKAAVNPAPSPSVDLAVNAAVVPAVVAAPADSSMALLEAARRILAALAVTTELRQRVDAIGAKLVSPMSQEALAGALTQMAILAAEQSAVFERGRQELTKLLAQINARLEDMTEYLVGEDAAQAESLASSQVLDSKVLEEVRALGSQSDGPTDLKKLQHQVRARLDAINGHLMEFRAREQTRMASQRERTASMRGRIEELEQQSASLRTRLENQSRLALIDPTTGIGNRLAYEQQIAREIARFDAEGKVFSLAAWDIDHFKSINDNYGHAAGDRVLKAVAEELLRSVRGTDSVARYGGEEFVVIFPATAGRDAERLCNDIRLKLSVIDFHFRGTPVRVTSSCGIATVAFGDTAAALFERADLALYRAKAEGRNRCVRA
jgi:diguanylate cyclase